MKELIKLAKEKGFDDWIELPYIDKNDGRTYYEEPSNSERVYYLWLCELQKWLRDEKRLLVRIEMCNNDTEKFKSDIVFYPFIDMFRNGQLCLNSKHFKLASESCEQALEKGLIEALKLIDSA